jgi:hypothetical protein
MPPAADRSTTGKSLSLALLSSAAVGVLGGMIGLGGAQFRRRY